MQDLRTAARQTRAWACYDCGKCTAICPISRTGARYSPRRQVLATNLDHAAELTGDHSLFACLTCKQCDSRCPADVHYTELVQQLREMAHGNTLEPECPHGGALQSVMRMMASGGTQQNRMAWLTDDLKTSSDKGEVFLFTGCTMYYDAFFPELKVATLDATKAAVKLLNRLGITPVVSPAERCCGHDLLWNGDRASFEALARHNTELLAASGAEVLVTTCAECLRTWKLDYVRHLRGKAPKLVHITELLAERLPELHFNGNGDRRVTYQDPCRLGRHLGVYEPPRQLLAALPGVELAEMRRSGSRAVCCAGGSWSSCDRYAKQIQVERLREARATGAELLVTACPKCQIHFRCAMKDPRLGEEIGIATCDVTELVASALAS